MRSRRRSFRSTTSTPSMPLDRRARAVITPIGPAPITRQRSNPERPGFASPISIPWSATASGSTSAACSNESSSGIPTSIEPSTATDSAYAPGFSPSPRPVTAAFWQTCSSPRLQLEHSPQGANGKTATRSPT